jgi:hypothetical protein
LALPLAVCVGFDWDIAGFLAVPDTFAIRLSLAGFSGPGLILAWPFISWKKNDGGTQDFLE